MATAVLLLVAQQMRQNDGSSTSHKAFLPSPSPKIWAQGVKIRMNTAPRCIATTKNPSKPRKKPTQAKQILLLQSRRLGTTHIFVIVGKKFGCLRRSLPAGYAALAPSHPSCPLPPGMGVALSLLPPDGAWGSGVQAGLCVGVAKAGSRQPSDLLLYLHRPP